MIPVQRDFHKCPPIDSRLNPSASEFFPSLTEPKNDQLTEGVLGNPVSQTTSSISDEHEVGKVPTRCPPLQSLLNPNAVKYFPTFRDCDGNQFPMARQNDVCHLSQENDVIRPESNTWHEQQDLVSTADNILNSSAINIMPTVDDTTIFPIQELQTLEGYGSDKFYNGHFMALNDAPYFNTTHMVYNPGTHLAAYFPEHFTEPTVPASIQVHPTASLLSNNYYNETPQYFTEVQSQPNPQLLLPGTGVQMHPHNPYTNPGYPLISRVPMHPAHSIATSCMPFPGSEYAPPVLLQNPVVPVVPFTVSVPAQPL